MVKRFHFDDEDDFQEDSYQESKIDESQEIKEDTSYQQVDTNDYDEEDINDEEEAMPKKKKKFVWKWWHYLLIIFVTLMIIFAGYLFLASRNDGPVYGNRCEGVVGIPVDAKESTIDAIKKEYPDDIQNIDIEIACKQVKIDIMFKDGMDTDKAKSIAEKTAQKLDELVGKTKEDGKTYSTLFGYIDNVAQYEVNLYLYSQSSEDFPIYATKHVQNDEFSYTLASIKDQESYQKAKDTLNKE